MCVCVGGGVCGRGGGGGVWVGWGGVGGVGWGGWVANLVYLWYIYIYIYIITPSPARIPTRNIQAQKCMRGFPKAGHAGAPTPRQDAVIVTTGPVQRIGRAQAATG